MPAVFSNAGVVYIYGFSNCKACAAVADYGKQLPDLKNSISTVI
jgi:hypothetical protein